MFSSKLTHAHLPQLLEDALPSLLSWVEFLSAILVFHLSMLRLELECALTQIFLEVLKNFLILVFDRHVESCDCYRKITSKQNSHGRTARVSTQPDLFSFLKYLLGSRICKNSNSQHPTVFHSAQASSPFLQASSIGRLWREPA